MGAGVIAVMLVTTLWAIIQTVRKIIRQQQHLSDETLILIVKNKIREDAELHDVALGHLGLCKECQARLDEIMKEI